LTGVCEQLKGFTMSVIEVSDLSGAQENTPS
jgi:hypothetical protein